MSGKPTVLHLAESHADQAGEDHGMIPDAGDATRPISRQATQGGPCRHEKHVALPQTWAQTCAATGRQDRKAA